MRKLLIFFVLLCLPTIASAQIAVDLKQQNLANWQIGTANFSGITRVHDGLFAVVSDDEPQDGFFLFRIDQDKQTGEVMSVYMQSFRGNPDPKQNAYGMTVRDCEGVAYCPETQTIFIAGEGDQAILEYDMSGVPTGRELAVPEIFGSNKIVNNMGFESLAYSNEYQLFWTTTESTLRADGDPAGPQFPGVRNVLRLQSFGLDLQPREQYAYRMDAGRTDGFGKWYAMGVSDICALPDGRLIVMERELNVKAAYVGSSSQIKLYLVDPAQGTPISDDDNLSDLTVSKYLDKTLLISFSTHINLQGLNYANYEGICLGTRLNDGRQTLLLVNDSQNGAGKGRFRLKDYVKVIILPEEL